MIQTMLGITGGSRLCEIGILNDPEDPRFYNILLEDEALQYKPCNDTKLAASAKHSKIALLDPLKTSYEQGEVIHVIVQVYDGYGYKKTTGGDLLRATMHDREYNYHASGVVIDNLDGTYLVEIKAFWTGPSIIKVILAYTREAITAVYRVRTEVLSTRNVYAKFQNGAYNEKSLCHPNRGRLLGATRNAVLCNMTVINTGMPFYCVKPKRHNLTCEHWKLVSSKTPYPTLSFTKCESSLFKSIHTNLTKTISVDIEPESTCKSPPRVPISKYKITKTWTSREPTGYFIGKKWNFVQIHGINNSCITDCIRNKRIYMIGDSTLRHWYLNLKEQTKCVATTGKWTKMKWHKASECELKDIGFKMGWYPHSQPFCVGNTWENAEHTHISIARRIDNIPDNENAVVVFQLFMHQLAFHHTVAQGRYKLIRKSVERLLRRNKNAVVLIKGPHTFSQTPAAERLNDCYVGLFTKILYDIFKGLHDRVVLLNNQDATIAAHIAWNHPPQNIISAMLEQMFYFACKK
ncbi:Neurexophilin and PC-esterase domain [Mactra antiquata]